MMTAVFFLFSMPIEYQSVQSTVQLLTYENYAQRLYNRHMGKKESPLSLSLSKTCTSLTLGKSTTGEWSNDYVIIKRYSYELDIRFAESIHIGIDEEQNCHHQQGNRSENFREVEHCYNYYCWLLDEKLKGFLKIKKWGRWWTQFQKRETRGCTK